MPSSDESDERRESFSKRDALWNILEGTASATGEEFFKALVENLARAMDVYGAFLTDYNPEAKSAKMLAFWTKDGWTENFTYPVAGTPCEVVYRTEKFFHVREEVAELFPTDLDFKNLGVCGYMGEPLRGIDDRVIGHLSVIDQKPLPDESRCLALFRIFAARAAAERKRVDAEAALREREEKLARLVEGAMDAIIELDEDLRVTQLNAAAAEVFGCRPEHVVGGSFLDLLDPEAQPAFTNLATELARSGEGRRSAWLREGFLARRGDGSIFPSEASLSCSHASGAVFYTVVLRNVEDRIRAAARIRALTGETEQLRAEVEALRGSPRIIGESPAIRKVLQAIDRVAPSDATVLLMGETGTGKEVIARAVHSASSRHDKPLVRVNCGAVPANLIESEFFGHEKGAFTGATARREGRFALAHGGTIFLDEIGELPLELQPKLLRVLQEGEFEPVGSSQTKRVDVRVVAATNRDLEEEVRAGRFREDLYYRLNVFPIQIPPLRDRARDVTLLAESFCQRLADDMGVSFERLSERHRDLLNSYHWPGNVRELQNVLERAFLTTPPGGSLDIAGAMPIDATPGPVPGPGPGPGGDESGNLRRG